MGLHCWSPFRCVTAMLHRKKDRTTAKQCMDQHHLQHRQPTILRPVSSSSRFKALRACGVGCPRGGNFAGGPRSGLLLSPSRPAPCWDEESGCVSSPELVAEGVGLMPLNSATPTRRDSTQLALEMTKCTRQQGSRSSVPQSTAQHPPGQLLHLPLSITT